MSLWEGGGAVGGLWLPGGGAPSCSYVAPVNPTSPSSTDLFGAHLSPQGVYVAAASPQAPLSQTVISGGVTLYGTANNGGGFGINPGVIGAGNVEAAWVFDLLGAGGVPAVCKAQLVATGGSFPTHAAWSDDLVSWTDDAALDVAGAHDVAYLRHRYWRLHFGPFAQAGGFYAGNNFTGFLLWGGA